MAAYMTNKARFRAMSCYLGAGTVPAGLAMLLLGGTTGAHAFNAGEVSDLNTVADLLALTNVQECSAGGYTRQNLVSITVTEDDANDRANVDCDDVAFGALAAGDTIKAVAIYETGASDAARTLLMVVDGYTVPTNGGTVTGTINDFVREL